jgi:hypothetical protein
MPVPVVRVRQVRSTTEATRVDGFMHRSAKGFAIWEHLLPPRPQGLRPHRRAAEGEELPSRLPLDGPPPRGAARRRQHGARARGHRAAPRQDRRGLVVGGEPGRDLAGQDLRRQVPCGGGPLARGGRGARRGRRLRHLPQGRARAAVSRRAPRPHPPSEWLPHARGGGQDGAPHRPRRDAALGGRPQCPCCAVGGCIAECSPTTRRHRRQAQAP